MSEIWKRPVASRGPRVHLDPPQEQRGDDERETVEDHARTGPKECRRERPDEHVHKRETAFKDPPHERLEAGEDAAGHREPDEHAALLRGVRKSVGHGHFMFGDEVRDERVARG